MSETNQCPECGAVLPASAPRGLCPACLLKRGLETNTAGYTANDAGKARWMPPSVEEITQRFPELEIVRLIGRGGMGAVYEARQRNLDRLVALKILPPEMGTDAAFQERFAREAQAMAKLNHPHIVTIHEFGERAGWYYFVMEYVDGVNLRGLLDSGHVSAKEALAIVPQICEALQYAHDQGIVHRDIKPENILLNKQGQVKIADFGLAKLMRHAPSAAAPEKVMGTPQYMAPEQIDHPADVDHRADIYSLGVVFYQMLTGELPPDPLTLPSAKVQIDIRLDDIVLRALQHSPTLRYQTATEFKTQIETVAATPDPESPPPPRGGYDVAPPAEISNLKSPSTPRYSRIAITGACWLVGALLAGIWLSIRSGEPFAIGGDQSTVGGRLIFSAKVLGLIVALLAVFATPTILGCISIFQIRRADGRLRGPRLALLDVLALPVLLLDAFILWATHGIMLANGQFHSMTGAPSGGDNIFIWLAMAFTICMVADTFIFRWVWRAANRSPSASPPPPSGVSPWQNRWIPIAALGFALAGLCITATHLLISRGNGFSGDSESFGLGLMALALAIGIPRRMPAQIAIVIGSLLMLWPLFVPAHIAETLAPLVDLKFRIPGYSPAMVDSTEAQPLALDLLQARVTASVTTIASVGAVDIYVQGVNGTDPDTLLNAVSQVYKSAIPKLPARAGPNTWSVTVVVGNIPKFPVHQVDTIVLHTDVEKAAKLGISPAYLDDFLSGKYPLPVAMEPATQTTVDKLNAAVITVGSRHIPFHDFATATIEKGPDHIERMYDASISPDAPTATPPATG